MVLSSTLVVSWTLAVSWWVVLWCPEAWSSVVSWSAVLWCPEVWSSGESSPALSRREGNLRGRKGRLHVRVRCRLPPQPW
ncbi:hypothetical protein [Gordonia aichiensis]